MNSHYDVDGFVESQLASWPMAKANYDALASVRRKEFEISESCHIVVQYNPARKVSTGANLSKASLAARPCFLCEKNRPQEQVSSVCGDFSILVNPFPIFSKHLTIVRNVHENQHIMPYLKQMREFSEMMPSMAIFFNGAQSGASAPDHMHFQAAQADAWPLFGDFDIAEKKDFYTDESLEIVSANIGRLVYRVTACSDDLLRESLERILSYHQRTDEMVNVIMYGGVMYVIPRKAFRPWQYSAEGDAQLMISPASVEVGGVFITPVEEHFNRITEEDIVSILDQVCF